MHLAKTLCYNSKRFLESKNLFQGGRKMATAKIVYASMTGNTEEIAEIVAENLKKLAVNVELNECTTVKAEDFLDADLAVVATYTYGDGELPDEIVDFYEDLQKLDLNDKIYGVCGSGDTFYDQFCKSVDDFDEAFATAGAIKGAESVKIDLAAEGEDIAKLEDIAKSLVGKLN
jgi:flavodoxin short chain